MRASRSTVRLSRCLLAYTLVASLLAPPPWQAAASSSSSAAGKAARAAAPWGSRRDAPSRAGELLVRFAAEVPEHGKDDIASSKGARRKGKLRGESRLEKLELQTAQDPAAAAEQLRREPGVELVEPNFLITRTQVTPNDPRFGEQWALKNTGQAGGAPGSDIGAASAWGSTTGLQSAVVAVVDSGIDFTHPDLRANRWVNAREKGNDEDDDRNGFVNDLHGWDWVTDSGVVTDENGHGTSVAGVIAAQGNNRAGVSGVMWSAGLMSLRVLDAGGTGDVADAVEAIDYAAAAGAQVVNCSWGTDADSLVLREAIERAGRRGVVVVASAGNGSRDLDTQPYYPASFDLPNLISVASSDQFDNLAQFSNWGATRMTVAAPGTDILTTKAGGHYRLVSGTSFSAPLVAGVAGLVKTQRPWLPAAAAKQAVVDGVRRVNTLAGKVAAGGVVSAPGALGNLRGPYDRPGGNGNGNGNGNGDGQGGPTPRPPDPGRGRGNYKATPPPATPRAPEGGPDLNRLRDEPSYVPQGPPPPRISSNAPPVCDDCYEAGGSDPQFSQARGLLANETGQPAVDLGSKNFNWSLPLVNLPGRGGLNLSLTLHYNSLVWTKQGNAYQYNADGGYPSPGFTLGFPQLQKPYSNGGGYMLITPSGGRVALVYKSPNIYETTDGSYTQLQLLANGWAKVVTTDGTQYFFEPRGNGERRCVQIKDRNGNFISVGYDWAGRVSHTVDTLGRQVNFLYNGNGQLFQLTQDRAGSGHTDLLAQFDYADVYIQPYFTDSNGNFVMPLGPYGTSVSLLAQVWIPDGGTHNFDYTVLGQVYKIRRHAPDGGLLNYQWFNVPGSPDVPNIALNDCPRFTERRDWVKYGVMQASQEVSTFFYTNAAGTVTEAHLPDGKTVYKEFFSDGSNGLRAGLTTGSELWYEGDKKKWTTTVWENDPAGGGPRVKETILLDKEGNRRRTRIEYNGGYNLPTHVREYAGPAGQDVELRLTATAYKGDAEYVSRRILTLPYERTVYDSPSGKIVSREIYLYDWGGNDPWHDPYFTGQAPSVNHDTQGYPSWFVFGRGNLTGLVRFDCMNNTTAYDDTRAVWVQRSGYNMAGSPLWTKDALGHKTSFSYLDSFSDTSRNGLGTLAYPTSVTDAEGYTSTAKFDYTTGAPTELRRPSSGTNAQNNVTYETHSFLYDWTARLVKDETVNTGFYTRWEYPADGLSVKTFQNIRPDLWENYSVQVLDGAGRVRRTAAYMPGSTSRYSGRQFYFDNMGRLVQWTNPTDTLGDANWTAAGDDAAAGWVSTSRTYDWQGRPRITTHPDTYTAELSYGGCGCAGGEVVTSRDQRGRLKKSYHDPLGRLSKVEELNYDSTVYSAAVYEYDEGDRVKSIRHYQGAAVPGNPYQERTFGYDGFGRLTSRTTPEQGTTTYGYFPDDTTQWVRDARGAKATYTYTARHLVSLIDYDTGNLVPGQSVEPTADVSFQYDAAGNRTQMTDGVGTATYHYDSLSRMDWEGRTFAGLSNTYTISYSHNNVGLASVTNPSQLGSSRVDYAVDHTGATTSVTGSGHWSPATYMQGIQYRASGGVKAASYGNGRSLSVTYTNMLRVDTWGVSGVTGWKYYYSDFGENTGRVTYAQNTFNHEPGRPVGADPTLDRSYDYDNVGRLFNSYTGTEARAHTGRPGGAWGTHDGPYSQAYIKDAWGNVTQKMGRAGDLDQFTAGYTNNRRNGFSYDAAGNLTFDGGQHFTYDATGQQVSVDWTDLKQWYDGDRMRVKKTEDPGDTPTYYLRSSVLGGQILAEINAAGGLQRGYVYGAGGGLMAILSGGVSWVYQDPATKSQRVADSAGNVYAGVDLDPWGRETGRSWNPQAQPRRYTTYTRDANDSDEAMHRRYNRWHLRFDQPDPADESYDLTNPQSFNRYAYVNNDPANLIDPTGLQAMIYYTTVDAGLGWAHFSDNFWGYSEGRMRMTLLGHVIRPDIDDPREWDPVWWGAFFVWEPWKGFGGAGRGGGATPQGTKEERCLKAIDDAQRIGAELDEKFTTAMLYGQDRGHFKKMNQLKSALEDALNRVNSNCNNHLRQQNADALEKAQKTFERPVPEVGARAVNVNTWKIGAAVGNIVGAVGGAVRAAWVWATSP